MKRTQKTLVKLTLLFGLLFFILIIKLGAIGTGVDEREFKGKWQIEVYGGLINMDPGVNDLARADAEYREFAFDRYYPYMHQYDSLNFWNIESKGEYKRISYVLSQGVRLKYHLSGNLAVSLGFQNMSVNKDSLPSYQYAWTEYDGDEYLDNRTYFQYGLSVSAYSPQLGIHYTKKLGKKVEIEGILSGGPLFAECGYISDWESGFFYRGENFDFMLFQDLGSLEMNGSGTGLALEAGLRFNFPLGSKVGLFLEGGYSYTQVTGISGSGREVRNGVENTWQGEWAMKLEEAQAEWGNLRIEFPSNYWPSQEESKRIGDFTLDLSGFQLRAGFFFRF